jgi:hypothetical protein
MERFCTSYQAYGLWPSTEADKIDASEWSVFLVSLLAFIRPRCERTPLTEADARILALALRVLWICLCRGSTGK